jgi:Ca2+-binding RTX toxin-like protein
MTMVKKIGDDNSNALRGTASNDLLIGNGGDDVLDGRGGNDRLIGGDGNDILGGGEGNNVLIGNAGDDLMLGGRREDDFRGGAGNDTVDYSQSRVGVQAFLLSNQSALGASGDIYTLVENVIGSSKTDFLQAGNAGDAFGGDGDDSLFGGALFQNDDGGRLRGDAGIDRLDMTFGNTEAWLQLDQGADIIDGFVQGEDKLFVDLSDFFLNNPFAQFTVTNSRTGEATGTNAQFIFDTAAEELFFDANGSADGEKTLVATFENSRFSIGDGSIPIGIALTNADFDFGF